MKTGINAKYISTAQGEKIPMAMIQYFQLVAVVTQEMSGVIYNQNYLTKLYHYKK